MVNLHISKTHSLITFVESLSDVKYASRIPKKIYLNKYKNDTKLIKNLKHLHLKIRRTSIYKYKKSKNLLEALYIESLKSKNINQLESRISAYSTSMKKMELEKYFIILKKLMPKYEQSIWLNDYNKLVSKKNKLLKLMNKHNYDSLIKKIAHFYGADIKKIDKIDVALYPISYGNNINAYRIKNLETIGVLVNKNQNLKWLLSAIILHEISHTLYFNSRIVKKNFSFKDKRQKLNIIEGMATSIGAGWGYQQISGKVTRTAWYNNKNYDKLARIIYPRLKVYLDSNKQMDKDFIKYVKELL